MMKKEETRPRKRAKEALCPLSPSGTFNGRWSPGWELGFCPCFSRGTRVEKGLLYLEKTGRNEALKKKN